MMLLELLTRPVAVEVKASGAAEYVPLAVDEEVPLSIDADNCASVEVEEAAIRMRGMIFSS